MYPSLPQSIIANGVGSPNAARETIWYYSVFMDRHIAQPDLIAADVLRKKPEYEDFARLTIIPQDRPTQDEEAYKQLQGCLELQEKYLFKKKLFRWKKEHISDLSVSRPKSNPL